MCESKEQETTEREEDRHLAEREELRRLAELLTRAKNGDESVLKELRTFLDHNPTNWRIFGDLAAHAQNAWIELICGRDLLWKETTSRRAQALFEEMAGPSPTPTERLLAERVVACWLQQQYADMAYAQAPKDISPKIGKYLEERQSETQKRYLNAIKALATLRRLLPASTAAAGRPVDEAQTRPQETPQVSDHAKPKVAKEAEIPAVKPRETEFGEPKRNGYHNRVSKFLEPAVVAAGVE